MKKVLTVLLSILMLASVFAGCSGGGAPDAPAAAESSGGGGAAPAPTSPEGKTTLNVLSLGADTLGQWKAMNDLFVEQNPQYEIAYEGATSATNEYYAIVKTRIASGRDIDVFQVHPGTYMRDLEADMYDLSGEAFLDNFNPFFVDTYKGLDGTSVFGLPMVYNLDFMFYNKRIFNELNLSPPDTWDSFITAVDTLKANGIDPAIGGFADNFVVSFWFMTQLTGLAPDDVHATRLFEEIEKGERKLSDPLFLEAFQSVKESAEKGYFSAASGGTRQDAATVVFAQEQAAMMMNGTWVIGQVKEVNPDIEFGMSPIPCPTDKQLVLMDPAMSMAIFKNSPNLEAALSYFDFLSQKEAAEIYGNYTQQLSCQKSAVIDSIPELMDVQAFMDDNGDRVALTLKQFSTKAELLTAINVANAKIFMGEDLDTAVAEAEVQIGNVLSGQK